MSRGAGGVGAPAVRAESRLRGEGAHASPPVGAVEQVTPEAVAGLPRLLLHHRHGAVRLGAAGVQAVHPGEHPLRGHEERGPLLDGGPGADDALPDGAEVARARVDPVGRAVLLLQLLPELLQQILHAGDLRLQVGDGRGAAVGERDGGEEQGGGEEQQQQQRRRRRRRRRRRMLQRSHVVVQEEKQLLSLTPRSGEKEEPASIQGRPAAASRNTSCQHEHRAKMEVEVLLPPPQCCHGEGGRGGLTSLDEYTQQTGSRTPEPDTCSQCQQSTSR